MFRYFTCVILVLLHVSSFGGMQQVSPELIEKSKRAVVSIETRASLSAYGNLGSWYGTGFIADKTSGLIITNAHVAGLASVCNYFVTFHSGQQKEAKLVYYDPYQDYAILKVSDIKEANDIEEIAFSKVQPKENQFVFLVGNSEGKGFSFHYGYISDMYSINGDMPQHSYIVNVNITGGASGSPILNEKGECVALHYAGGDTYGIGLKSEYVQKGLEAAKKGVLPIRKSAGIIYNIYSLDKAVMHRNFNKDVVAEYMKKFPDARNKVISVYSTIKGYQAENVLQPGDIIWAVDGKEIGASLYDLDNLIDLSKDDKVKFIIFRDGVKKEAIIELQNLADHRISKLVQFGGATFFNADDFVSNKSGVSVGSLVVANIQNGSSFSNIDTVFPYRGQRLYRLNITHINNHRVHNLDELVSVLPEVSKTKFLKVEAINHQPYWKNYGETWQSGHEKIVADVMLDSVDSKYRVFNFNDTFEWKEEETVVVPHDQKKDGQPKQKGETKN